MVLLQTPSNSITDQLGLSKEMFFYLELTIIVCVIIYQLIHSFLVYKRIVELRKIFDHQLIVKSGIIEKKKLGQIEEDSLEIQYEDESLNEKVGEDVIRLSLLETRGKNEIITRIKKTVNTYLINNYGATVNYSIIKDIIDREVEVKDGEISQTITTPLYLGLAATMIGIIFGLLSMPSLNDDGFSDGVNALIRGVKWAMTASLFGLICTTILSSFFYKNANRKVLQEKNKQLSYLQAKLLPELNKAEDSGVSGLKASIDMFSRKATIISDNILDAALQFEENLVMHQTLLEKIEKIGMVKLSEANLILFEKFDENMIVFEKFSTNLNGMEKISSNLMDFANRTSNIDKMIEEIDKTLNMSDELLKFLHNHFEEIESAGSAALKSVGLADKHFEGAIEILEARTDEVINRLYKSAGEHADKLEKVYEKIGENFSDYYQSNPEFQIGCNFNDKKIIESVNETNKIVNEINKFLILSFYKSKGSSPKKHTFKKEMKPLSFGKLINEIFR